MVGSLAGRTFSGIKKHTTLKYPHKLKVVLACHYAINENVNIFHFWSSSSLQMGHENIFAWNYPHSRKHSIVDGGCIYCVLHSLRYYRISWVESCVRGPVLLALRKTLSSACSSCSDFGFFHFTTWKLIHKYLC